MFILLLSAATESSVDNDSIDAVNFSYLLNDESHVLPEGIIHGLFARYTSIH